MNFPDDLQQNFGQLNYGRSYRSFMLSFVDQHANLELVIELWY